MKKYLSILLALAMSLTLYACARKQPAEPVAPAAQTPAPAAEPKQEPT